MKDLKELNYSGNSYNFNKLESNLYMYKRILIILGISSIGFLVRNTVYFLGVYDIAACYFAIYLTATVLIILTRTALPILFRNKHYRATNRLIILSCALLFYFLVLMSVLDSVSIKDYKYVNDYNFTAYIFGIVLVGFTLRISWKISALIFAGGMVLFISLYYRYTPAIFTLQSVTPLLAINILSVYFSYAREKFYLKMFRDRSIYHDQSIKDSLTQTYNRRYMTGILKENFVLQRESGTPFCCIFADIDHFKTVNDMYGHEAGDAVLRQFAQTLLHESRISDEIIRYGGEEFLIILRNTRFAEALMIAERIRKAVEEMVTEQCESGITASFGITEAGDNDDADRLIKRVDRLLYQAKEEGRNRCCSG